ncbi:hypothetical protein [Ruegeria atlantica]|uniref:hypothetical protein n=1 Tax=Ruegeria atlantica TaxID=81569 RepID=UPI001481C298|nr:hypothetical protein [Ruegeria atlantica]
MTKASDPKARPQVAKNDANKVSGIYDFVQSPEWQEVLEKARIQQESNPAAGKANGGAAQPSSPDSNKTQNSTAGSQPASAQNVAAGQPGSAGKPAQAPNTRQSGESAQGTTASGAGGKTVNNDSGATDNVAHEKHGDTSAAPPNDAPVPGINPDSVSEDLPNSEPSLKLSEDEVADRLRKNLIERIEDQKRSRRKTRLGLVAAGCGIGVAASSSIFLILSGLNGSGPTENADQTSQEAVAPSAVAQQDVEMTENLAPTAGIASGTEDLTVRSATVFDTSSDTPSPGGDTDGSEDLASLSLPQSEPAGAEPELSSSAPSVLSFVPTLIQPPLPITLLSYRPRPEVNLGFVGLQTSPEIFSTSVAFVETTVTEAALEEFSEGATRTATATLTAIPSPVVPVQPDALSYAASQVPLDIVETGPEQVGSYQPELDLVINLANDPMLFLPDVVASFEIEQPPELRVLPEPDASELSTVALDPATQPEDSGRAAEVVTTVPSEPLPEPVELAALRVAPELSDAPAPLATPAPSETLSALDAPRLSAAPGSLETPNAPRVPIPLDAVVSLAPLLQEASAPSKPIERTALPGDAITPSEPAPAPANTVVAFRLYAPSNVPQGVVDSVVTNLTSTGHELSGQARVGFGITQSNVRFYHKQDEERAAALAKDAGALLRDFTGANVKTPSGIIELWLSGEGSGVARVKRTAPRSTVRAQAPSRVNRLRSQVLSKLKKATTQ